MSPPFEIAWAKARLALNSLRYCAGNAWVAGHPCKHQKSVAGIFLDHARPRIRGYVKGVAFGRDVFEGNALTVLHGTDLIPKLQANGFHIGLIEAFENMPWIGHFLRACRPRKQGARQRDCC